MYGITGFITYEGQDDFKWFDSIDEMMKWLAVFDITDLSELEKINENIWQL